MNKKKKKKSIVRNAGIRAIVRWNYSDQSTLKFSNPVKSKWDFYEMLFLKILTPCSSGCHVRVWKAKRWTWNCVELCNCALNCCISGHRKTLPRWRRMWAGQSQNNSGKHSFLPLFQKICWMPSKYIEVAIQNKEKVK